MSTEPTLPMTRSKPVRTRIKPGVPHKDSLELMFDDALSEAREQGAREERERLRERWSDWLHDHPGRAFLMADLEVSMDRFLRDPDAP